MRRMVERARGLFPSSSVFSTRGRARGLAPSSSVLSVRGLAERYLMGFCSGLS